MTQPDRTKASAQRLRQRTQNLAKLMFYTGFHPADVRDGTADQKWDEWGATEQRRFIRYAVTAMKALSVDYSRALGVDVLVEKSRATTARQPSPRDALNPNSTTQQPPEKTDV